MWEAGDDRPRRRPVIDDIHDYGSRSTPEARWITTGKLVEVGGSNESRGTRRPVYAGGQSLHVREAR